MEATRQDEYMTLREELLQHQERRLPILGVALTVAVGLCGTALELTNPYLPLGALFLLFSARIQLAETQYGVQRIAAYVRVMHEENNDELNWETGSYKIRKDSARKKSPLWRIVPFSALDLLLFGTGVVACATSIALAYSQAFDGRHICSAAAAVWLVLWMLYSVKTRALATMRVDEIEEASWKKYKKTLLKSKNGDQSAEADLSTPTPEAAAYRPLATESSIVRPESTNP